jgi:hypothetical protein
MSDDDIELTDAEIALFANERVPYDRSERTPLTHAAKMARNLMAARETIRDLQAKLEQEREYHRLKQYPKPFKVGSVLGRYKDLSYALQILNVWNTWPNVDIEVALPFTADGEAK